MFFYVFFFKQKTAYEMRISDWSSDVCSSDLLDWEAGVVAAHHKLSAIERRILDGDTSCIPDWVRYDWEFHRSLVSACNLLALMNTLSSVFDRFLRYHLIAESFRGAPVVDDPQRLFELALQRDIEGARPEER